MARPAESRVVPHSGHHRRKVPRSIAWLSARAQPRRFRCAVPSRSEVVRSEEAQSCSASRRSGETCPGLHPHPSLDRSFADTEELRELRAGALPRLVCDAFAKRDRMTVDHPPTRSETDPPFKTSDQIIRALGLEVPRASCAEIHNARDDLLRGMPAGATR